MNLLFATEEEEDYERMVSGIEVVEEPVKPEAAVPPFWWEDYNGREGKRVNSDAAMAAVRAMCG